MVEKGTRDAAAALGVDLECNFAPSGDMSDMAALILAQGCISIVQRPLNNNLAPPEQVQTFIAGISSNSKLTDKQLAAIVERAGPGNDLTANFQTLPLDTVESLRQALESRAMLGTTRGAVNAGQEAPAPSTIWKAKKSED